VQSSARIKQVPGNFDSRACASEAIARCQTLAGFSEDADRIRRTFLSPPMRECFREISGWLESLGVSGRVDAAGNLRAVYEAAQPNAPRLIIGSHLDTVPNAGAYDGILGVVLAIALLQGLNRRRLPFAIEIVGFSEEEGVRFGVPFLGSLALLGRLDEELLCRQDEKGVSVRQAIQDFGLNPTEIPQAALQNDVLGYLEFHIEQGPVLENQGHPLAAVEAIAGQTRLEFTFIGHSNHAGTTPMKLRYDAVAAAAEWICSVERRALRTEGLVATVGTLHVKPGASNVIAGETCVSLDVRHRSDQARNAAVGYFMRQAEEIALRRGLRARCNVLLDQRAVLMDSFLVSQIEQAIRQTGFAPHRMVSGAGHDAMILAGKMPSAMIFLRTPGGVSHDPAESVLVEDVASAIDCGVRLLDQLAASPEFLSRTPSA
jgi:allantoate deiminase